MIVGVEHVAALELRAIDFAKRGDFGADARSVNEELTRAAPANQGAWTRLARCCMELGQLDEATAALDAVLVLNPQNTIARNLQAEVGKRRAGPAAEPAPRRRRTSSSSAEPSSPRSAARRTTSTRTGRTATATLPGFGRAEFTALGHLPPANAAESLTSRIEPLLMALNERPFAAKAVEARNRAGHAGARLFRRGSLDPVAPGWISVAQQGGRWEPQLSIGFFAAPHWGRDAVAAGLGFNLSEGGSDDRADRGRERVFEYFQAFQEALTATWRQHLTDWMRVNGGFVQVGRSAAGHRPAPVRRHRTDCPPRQPRDPRLGLRRQVAVRRPGRGHRHPDRRPAPGSVDGADLRRSPPALGGGLPGRSTKVKSQKLEGKVTRARGTRARPAT